MRPVLITSFEAFGGRNTNSSEAFVRSIDLGDLSQKFQISFDVRTLPVSWSQCRQRIDFLFQTIDPLLVFAFGEAPSPSVRLERMAFNEAKLGALDNEGSMASNSIIDPQSPAILKTTLLSDTRIFDESKEPIDIVESFDAGRYLCNLSYFKFLNKKSTSLFIHVPVGIEKNFINPAAFSNFSTNFFQKLLEQNKKHFTSSALLPEIFNEEKG